MVTSISVQNLLDMGDSAHIIDLRSIEKYNDNHIPRAINIPFEKLLVDPRKYLNYIDTYYLYCQIGKTSLKTCIYLQKQGFKVVNVIGGYEEWIIEK